MNNQPTSGLLEDIGETIGYVEAIVENKFKIAKLNATEQVAQLVSMIATGIMLAGMLFIILCMLSITLGFALVEFLNWTYAGSFLAITVLYIVLAILLFNLRQKLFANPVIGIVLDKIYKTDKHESIY